MPRPQHEEPVRGDEIMHINSLGEPNGKVSEVKRIVSEDRHNDLFEVIDSFNRTFIITRLTETSWIEVDWED